MPLSTTMSVTIMKRVRGTRRRSETVEAAGITGSEFYHRGRRDRSHVEAPAIRSPALGAKVRGVRSLVADLGQFRGIELSMAPDAGFQGEIQDSAGQHGAFHRVGRLPGLEHDFDILHQAAEVMVRPARLKIHERGDRRGGT